MMRTRRAAPFVVLALAAVACRGSAAAQPRAEFWGFTGPWDAASHASVRAHGSELDAVVSGWITIDSATAQPLLPSAYPDTVRPLSGTVPRLALVTTWHGSGFHAAPIRLLGRDRAALARAAGRIARHASEEGYRGLVLDFEALEAADLDAQLRVVKAIADSARAHGVGPVTVCIPAEDTLAYPSRALLGVADHVLVMLYDQHWAGGEPGPVAAPEWFRRALATRVREAGAERLIAGLPAYGYRWFAGRGKPAESVSWAQARRIAEAEGAPLERDAATRTMRARREGAWEMWATDAALLRALVAEAETLGVRRFALWRLGQEDPAFWSEIVRRGAERE